MTQFFAKEVANRLYISEFINHYRISSLESLTRQFKFIVFSIFQTIKNYFCSFSKLNFSTKHPICDLLPYFLLFHCFSFINSFIRPNFRPPYLLNYAIYRYTSFTSFAPVSIAFSRDLIYFDLIKSMTFCSIHKIDQQETDR